jgi:NADH:ubiquinone oxidoreductase subunit 4 (subunit M)
MYPMHLISLFCIYISFCIIINLWGSAIVFEAKDSKRAITLRTVLVILTSIDFILVTMVSVQCYTLSDLDDVLEGPWYKRMTTYQSIGMSMLSMFFLIFGYAAQRKIWR